MELTPYTQPKNLQAALALVKANGGEQVSPSYALPYFPDSRPGVHVIFTFGVLLGQGIFYFEDKNNVRQATDAVRTSLQEHLSYSVADNALFKLIQSVRVVDGIVVSLGESVPLGYTRYRLTDDQREITIALDDAKGERIQWLLRNYAEQHARKLRWATLHHDPTPEVPAVPSASEQLNGSSRLENSSLPRASRRFIPISIAVLGMTVSAYFAGSAWSAHRRDSRLNDAIARRLHFDPAVDCGLSLLADTENALRKHDYPAVASKYDQLSYLAQQLRNSEPQSGDALMELVRMANDPEKKHSTEFKALQTDLLTISDLRVPLSALELKILDALQASKFNTSDRGKVVSALRRAGLYRSEK